jgi:oxygen-independent coproporphyrinogen-3 oxidase
MAETSIPRSAYLHFPFCRRRCYYCDFPISVLGDKTDINTSPSIQEYVDVLCREIAITPTFGSSLVTIFFGGGTPSLLPVAALERILTALDKRFGIAREAEISLEIDPATFSLEQLEGYRKAGVNRVSLGVQAFQEELLKICGRFHSVQDVFIAIELIRQVGFSSFSLDLISGLPHQTIGQWQHSLEIAISLAPDHLSCYDLVLESVTAFGKKYASGKSPLPADETAAKMYRLAQQILTNAGYQHYEISNYAHPGYQCRHNRVYWENRPYYGFGMGAASYVSRQRFTRPRTRKEYYAWVKNLSELQGKIDCPEVSNTDVLLETLMLGFRLAEGIKASQIQDLFGQKMWQKIVECLHPYYQKGWVLGMKFDGKLIDFQDDLSKSDRLCLTDPEGFLFSNTVLAALFEKFVDNLM